MLDNLYCNNLPGIGMSGCKNLFALFMKTELVRVEFFGSFHHNEAGEFAMLCRRCRQVKKTVPKLPNVKHLKFREKWDFKSFRNALKCRLIRVLKYVNDKINVLNVKLLSFWLHLCLSEKVRIIYAVEW